MSKEYKAISEIKYLKIIAGGYDADGVFQEILINIPQPCDPEISFTSGGTTDNNDPIQSFCNCNYPKTCCLKTQYTTTADIIIKQHYNEEECKYYE